MRRFSNPFFLRVMLSFSARMKRPYARICSSSCVSSSQIWSRRDYAGASATTVACFIAMGKPSHKNAPSRIPDLGKTAVRAAANPRGKIISVWSWRRDYGDELPAARAASIAARNPLFQKIFAA